MIHFYVPKTEKGTIWHSDINIGAATMKRVWRFLRKLKIELPYDLTIPLRGIYPEKPIIQKDTGTLMFTSTQNCLLRIVYNSQDMEAN